MASIDDHERQDLQLQAASLAASRGITSVHEMSMPHWNGDADLQVLLDHRARLPVDALPVVASTDLAVAIVRGLRAIGGDLPVDGSIGARTAWLEEPYVDGEGTGASYLADDELAEFFHGGHIAGLQVGVHAIGDRAIEQVLSVWERVYSRPRLARAAALPRAPSSRRALRAGLDRTGRAGRHARPRRLGAACVRRDLGWNRRVCTSSGSAGSAPAA